MREVTDALDTGNMPSEAATFISEVSKYRTIHPGDVLWMGADSVPQNMKIANFNGVPQDTRPAKFTSGVRLGTPATTTRGLKEADYANVADFIDRAIVGKDDEGALKKIRQEVADFCRKFPMPH